MMRLLLSLLCLISVCVYAQPTADFSVPANACLYQNLQLDNLSTDADRYEWDFCQGDLAINPTASLSVNLSGNITTGVDFVFDGTNWYGFVTNQNSNSILRLDFGPDISSTPSIVDLGNIDNNINLPTDIKVVIENGEWYGFVYGLQGPLIARIDFGTSLDNDTPTSQSVVAGAGSVNGGFDMAFDGTNWIIVYSQFASFNVIRLPTIDGIPTAPDMLTGIASPFPGDIGDVEIAKAGSDYFAYAVSFGGKTLQRLSFGSTLFSTPTIDNITTPEVSSISPYGIAHGEDDGLHYVFISSLEGSMIRVDLGSDLTLAPPSATSLGSLQMLENTLKVSMVKHRSSWHALATSWSSTNLYRIDFNSPGCEASLTLSEDEQPVVHFIASGPKTITLRAFKNDGSYSEISRQVTVSPEVSPVLTVDHNHICTASPTLFSVSSGVPLSNVNWDFGDSGTASGNEPSHQYTASGTYNVTVSADAPTGCSNVATYEVNIYDPPTIDFDLPVAAVVCTGQQYTFNNLSVFDPALEPQWEWKINGSVVSAASNLTFAFDDAASFDVSLTGTIPGCDGTMNDVFTVTNVGPAVNFSFSGICDGDETEFTNETVGSVSSFTWDFGDGTSADDAAPTHVYTGLGTYTVKLTATNPAGCANSHTASLTIYSTPQPAFTLDLPPFSCSGTPSQFHDATPPPPDSNVSAWLWTFDEDATGEGKNPVHTFMTAGNRNVELEVTTDKGCSASVMQEVTIAQSPSNNIAISSACVNQQTTFVGADADVEMWQWTIHNTNYTISNPVHVFITPGTYNVQLVKTGFNDCVTPVTRQVIVPEVPDLDFSVANPCATQETILEQHVKSNTDPVASFTWTLPGNITKTGTEVKHDFEMAGSYPVTLRAVMASGCGYNLSRNISIFEAPVAKFTATPVDGAAPLSVTFTNQSEGASNYLWSFNDADEGTSTLASPQYVFTELGKYVVDLVAVNDYGCIDSFSGSVNVIVPFTELELESFELALDQTSGTWQSLIRVKNNSNYTITAFNAIVDLGAGTRLSERIAGELVPGESETFVMANHFIRTSGSGYVCVELSLEGDEQITNNTICQPLGGQATLFAPHPNPARDNMKLNVIAAEAGPVEIRIVNTMGANMYRKVAQASVGLNVFTIDLEYFDTGMYVVLVRCGDATMTTRVVVE